MEHLEFGQPQTVNDCIEILSEQQTAITASKQKKIAIVVEAAPAGKKIDCSFMRIKGERCFGGDTKEHIEWSEGEARTYVRGQQIKSFLQEYNELARNETRFTNYIKEQMALALSTLSAMEASAAHIDPKAYNESQLLFQVYKDPEREYLMKRSEVQVMTELLAHSKNGSRYIDFFTANKRLITLKHPMFDLMTNITELFNRHDSFYKTARDLSKEYVVFVVLGKNHLRSQRDGLREAAKYLIGKLKSSASEMPFVVLYQFKENRGCSNGALFNETEFMKSTLFIFTMYTAANLITLKLLFKRENEWNYMWAHESENLNTPVERTTEESSTFAPS